VIVATSIDGMAKIISTPLQNGVFQSRIDRFKPQPLYSNPPDFFIKQT